MDGGKGGEGRIASITPFGMCYSVLNIFFSVRCGSFVRAYVRFALFVNGPSKHCTCHTSQSPRFAKFFPSLSPGRRYSKHIEIREIVYEGRLAPSRVQQPSRPG